MFDFTFSTMPQGINRCKDTKKRRKERSLLFFLDNIIFLRKALPCRDCGTGSVGQHVKQMCIYCSENHEIPIPKSVLIVCASMQFHEALHGDLKKRFLSC